MLKIQIQDPVLSDMSLIKENGREEFFFFIDNDANESLFSLFSVLRCILE